MNGSAPKQHSRIFGLDLVRAIAIFIVVISHTSGILKLRADMPRLVLQQETYRTATTTSPHEAADLVAPSEQQPRTRGRIWPLGVVGVELFFVLSGFLVGNILIRRSMAAQRFGMREIGRFLLRRWMRTLPAYWVVLTILVFIYPFIGRPISFGLGASFYLFIQNLISPHPHFFNEAWSLSVEEWFYLTTPLAILVAYRLFPRVDRYKLLLRTFVVYILVFTLARVFNYCDPKHAADPDMGIRKVVIYRLDAIMYGVLIALLLRNSNSFVSRHKRSLFWLGVVSSIVVVCLLYMFGGGVTAYLQYAPFYRIFLYTLIPLSFCLLLPYASEYVIQRAQPNIVERAVSYTSRISYSIYLTHFNIFTLLGFSRYHFNNYGYAIAFYVLYIGCMMAISHLLHICIERPFLRLRDRTMPEQGVA